MIEQLDTPQIESVEEVGTYAKYEVGPLQAGYGVTLGNAVEGIAAYGELNRLVPLAVPLLALPVVLTVPSAGPA